MTHKYSESCTCNSCEKKFRDVVFSNITMEVQCDHCEVSYDGPLKNNENISHQ